MNRGSGQTSRQMLRAEPGALYIWVHRHSLAYANALAHHLGRGDLEVTSPKVLDDGGNRLRGRRFPEIVVDHACQLTDRQYDVLDDLRARLTADTSSPASTREARA